MTVWAETTEEKRRATKETKVATFILTKPDGSDRSERPSISHPRAISTMKANNVERVRNPFPSETNDLKL